MPKNQTKVRLILIIYGISKIPLEINGLKHIP